ncbi:TIGR01440 family protein [Sporosarcina koreensis]|uniref:TIGR01440 family protein n=1 Tax=Sporosarcina koreensis TaxID=334735 RepID=UPI00059135ED|nr:TIGR01440 family protein [Sporosarcina koreensis]
MDTSILWRLQIEQVLTEFAEQAPPEAGTFFVIGCSTSEVAGKRIGTAGALEVAEALYGPLAQFAETHKVHLAFQGCEHINRAVTIERRAAAQHGYDRVSVVPVTTAGGSMSAYAYEHLDDAVVVESVRAHAGIDIGQTLIGMQLKPVAVPIRTSVKQIGEAVVTCATTRPKLIGGARAQYE